MKKLLFLVIFIFLSTIHADETHTYEAMFTLINYGTSWNVTFKFEAVSVRWDDDYNLTSGYSTGQDGAQNPDDLFAGFDLIIDNSAGEHPIMALGKYKISAWEGGQQKAYFYMDWRTSDYDTSPDVYFKYDVGNDRFRNQANTQTIDYSTQTVWNLVSGISHVTTGFEPYAPINTNASNYNGHPKITWQRQSTEDYVTGYDIYRSLTNQITGYTKIGSSTNTSYIDYDLNSGPGNTAYYKVKAVNGSKLSDFSSYTSISYSGMQKATTEPNLDNSAVYNYKLDQNYPNPFNPATTINYSLQEDDQVSIKVYNLTGEKVKELVNEYKSAGKYSINFNAENLPSGIYIYRIVTNNFSETKKFTLLK